MRVTNTLFERKRTEKYEKARRIPIRQAFLSDAYREDKSDDLYEVLENMFETAV